NEAQTLDTQLNVFATFDPKLPPAYQNVDSVFLANIDPELQAKVIDQVKAPKLVGIDSMNLWINIKKQALTAAMKRVDVAFMNETEARLFSGEHNIVKAARAIQRV